MLQADPKVKAAMTAKPAAKAGAKAGAAPAAEPAAPQEFPKKANGSTLNYHPETGEKFATPADAQAFLDAKLKADPNYGQPKTAAAAPAKPKNFDAKTGEPLSDKAKADAAFDASPEGQAIQAKVDAMPAPEPDAAAAPAAAPTTPAPKAADADAADAGKPGFLQSKIKGRRPPAGPSQAEIDADRERLMGKFTDSIARHKKAMTESAIRSGELSFFRKQ
jgi:hypothetical protein